MKFNKKTISAVCIIVFALIFLMVKAEESKKEANLLRGKIQRFAFAFGSFHGGYYDYEIFWADEKLIFTAEGHNGIELNIYGEIDSSVLDDISNILIRYNAYKWNEFSQSNNSILDGYSFSLKVLYDSGSLVAEGYEKFPKGFNDFESEMKEYLDEVVNKINRNQQDRKLNMAIDNKSTSS